MTEVCAMQIVVLVEAGWERGLGERSADLRHAGDVRGAEFERRIERRR
jgi:hypothetical protein